ncbi:MAG: hypothetical protein Q9227_004456 [Pyrenula ochraceoflavens]
MEDRNNPPDIRLRFPETLPSLGSSRMVPAVKFLMGGSNYGTCSSDLKTAAIKALEDEGIPENHYWKDDCTAQRQQKQQRVIVRLHDDNLSMWDRQLDRNNPDTLTQIRQHLHFVVMYYQIARRDKAQRESIETSPSETSPLSPAFTGAGFTPVNRSISENIQQPNLLPFPGIKVEGSSTAHALAQSEDSTWGNRPVSFPRPGLPGSRGRPIQIFDTEVAETKIHIDVVDDNGSLWDIWTFPVKYLLRDQFHQPASTRDVDWSKCWEELIKTIKSYARTNGWVIEFQDIILVQVDLGGRKGAPVYDAFGLEMCIEDCVTKDQNEISLQLSRGSK